MNVAHARVPPSAGKRDSRPRRVLMIAACPFPAPRGTPARILRMAEGLGRRGHHIHVATYHLGGATDGYPFTTHRIRSIRSYDRLDPGPTYRKLAIIDPLLARMVSRIAREIRPEIIHAHHYEGLLAALPLRLRYSIPTIYDAHVLLDGEIEYYKLGLPRRMRGAIARFLDRRLPRRADHVVAVSDSIRDTLCGDYDYPEDFVTVVPNGVEPSFFERQRNALPDDGFRRLIFTGNLAVYQGAARMLHALALLLERRSDIRLLVVTDSDRSEFERKASDLGVSHAIEYRRSALQELPSLIASADVALNPRTKCPGTPQKLLNYFACAVPVVSFEGSAKYLQNEVNGLVVKDNDVPEFARAIERLLEQPALARRLAAAAGEFAEKELSWELNVRRVEDVYDSILSGRPNSGL